MFSKNWIVSKMWLRSCSSWYSLDVTIPSQEEIFSHQPRMSDEKFLLFFDILGQGRNQHDLKAEWVE